MTKWICLATTLLFIVGCQKNAEKDDLAKAQSCLDKVTDSNPSAATNCFSYVQAYNDQQANILKCAILDTSAGFTNSKVVSAYNILADKTQTSSAASFMTVLALSVPTPAAGLATAQQADTYCQATGVVGFEYISSLIVMGSSLNVSLTDLAIPVDTTDPTSVNTAVQSLITQCTASNPPASCTSAALGSAATTVAASYCSQSNADQSVCSQISSAVASAGGSPTNVSQALFCYLNKKTYNPSTQACQ